MIDVSFLGRDTARNPIVVKSIGRIEKDAKRRRWVDAALLAFVLVVIAAAVVGFLA